MRVGRTARTDCGTDSGAEPTGRIAVRRAAVTEDLETVAPPGPHTTAVRTYPAEDKMQAQILGRSFAGWPWADSFGFHVSEFPLSPRASRRPAAPAHRRRLRRRALCLRGGGPRNTVDNRSSQALVALHPPTGSWLCRSPGHRGDWLAPEPMTLAVTDHTDRTPISADNRKRVFISATSPSAPRTNSRRRSACPVCRPGSLRSAGRLGPQHTADRIGET